MHFGFELFKFLLDAQECKIKWKPKKSYLSPVSNSVLLLGIHLAKLSQHHRPLHLLTCALNVIWYVLNVHNRCCLQKRCISVMSTAPSAPVINPQMPNSATQTSLRVRWSLFSDDTVEYYDLYYRPVLEDTPADSISAPHGTTQRHTHLLTWESSDLSLPRFKNLCSLSSQQRESEGDPLHRDGPAAQRSVRAVGDCHQHHRHQPSQREGLIHDR